MRFTVSIQGLDQLSLQVKYLQTAAAQGLKLGVNEAAAIFQVAAKENCPVLTGRLQASIHTDTVTDTAEVQTVTVSPTFPESNKYGFEPPYARRIEFGFVGTDSLGRRYHQAAQPYMRPAFDENQAEATAAIKDSVYAELDSAMAKSSASRLKGAA